MIKRESEIDNTHEITEEQWVISLVRKDNKVFEQHAFLILEGIENNQHVIWFIDFVGKSPGHIAPNARFGFIRIEGPEDNEKCKITKETSNPKTSSLIGVSSKRMMDIKINDKLHSTTRYLNRNDAKQLILRIKEEKKSDPHRFSLLGSESHLTASSAHLSRKDIGENCFTWAKRQLSSCDIEIEPNSTAEWLNSVICITSINLGRTQLSEYINIGFFKEPRTIALGIGLISAGVGGFLLNKYIQ